jgi:hypothetical protein
MILFTNLAVSCKQQKENSMMNPEQQKEILIQMRREMATRLSNFSERPMYYLQVNKAACRVIVRVNDIPLSFFFIRDEGQSMLLPINAKLFSSGRHTFSIDVYPMRGRELLTKEAHVNVRLIRLADISLPLIQAERLMELNLPIDIGTLELPFYTAFAEFYAHVPFDYSHILEGLKDLRKIRNLEEKVVRRYNEIRQNFVNFDAVQDLKERVFIFYGADMDHSTESDLINSVLRSFNNFFNPNVVDRRVAPIENYEMMIVGHGRFVLLRERETLQHMIRVTYFDTEEEKAENPQNNWINRRFVLLAMPKGSDRLEIFF